MVKGLVYRWIGLKYTSSDSRVEINYTVKETAFCAIKKRKEHELYKSKDSKNKKDKDKENTKI